MHELSIALALIDLAAEEAQKHGGTRIHAIHLRLGPLAGVVKEALLSAYELAQEQSLGDAALVIEDVPIIARCPHCQKDQPVASIDRLCCSECGTPTPEIVSGRDLEMVALELE